MLVSRVCSFQFSFCCLVILQEARFRKISVGVTIQTQTLLKAADSQAHRVSSSMTIKIASLGFCLGLFSNLVWVRCTNPGFPAEAQVRRLWCLQMTLWPVVRAGGGGGGMQRRKEDRESVVAVLADDVYFQYFMTQQHSYWHEKATVGHFLLQPVPAVQQLQYHI